MLARSRYRVLGLVAVGLLLGGAARGETITVADFYGEPDVADIAGSTSLLVGATLAANGASVTTRDALARAVAATGGTHLVVSVRDASAVLAATRARYLVVGIVRREFAALTAQVQVIDASGAVAASFGVRSGGSDVSELALEIVASLGKTVGVKARVSPRAALGQLRPFARASVRLAAGDPGGAGSELLGSGAAPATGIAANKEIARALAADTRVPLSVRIEVALLDKDARSALALAEQEIRRDATSAVGWGAMARAQLQRGDLRGARKSLAQVKDADEPIVQVARARLAQADHDPRSRDAALASALAGDPYPPALVFAAELPPGELRPDVERNVVTAAELVRDRHPRVAALVGLRAARSGVEPQRGLQLVRIAELDDREIEQVRRIVDDAVKQGWAVGHRLRAELLLRDGKEQEALASARHALASAPADSDANLIAGRLLHARGDHDAAIKLLEIAARGNATAGREYARSLARWKGTSARVLALGSADSSAEVLVAQGLDRLENGDPAGAIEKLRAALALSPNDPEVAKALARAQAAAGKAGAGGPVVAHTSPLATEVGRETATTRAKEVALDGPGIAEIAAALDGLVGALPPLAEASSPRVLLVRLAGDEPFYSLRRVNPERLRLGLTLLIERPPYVGQAFVGDAALEQPLSRPALHRLATAAGAGFVLAYQLRADGAQAQVKLVLFDVRTDDALEVQSVLRGDSHGMVELDLRLLGVPLALLLGIGLWFLIRTARGSGEIYVRVERDPNVDGEIYSIVLSRSSRRPAIPNLQAYVEHHKKTGTQRGKLRASHVAKRTSFSGVPAGVWHVHLYGTHTEAGELGALPDSCTQRIAVRRNQTENVTFDLVPRQSTFRVRIYDGDDPVAGALVWWNDDEASARKTDRHGEVKIMVGSGDHVLRLSGNGTTSGRRIQVYDVKARQVTFNLVRERKLAEISGGITIALDSEQDLDTDVDLDDDAPAAAVVPVVPVVPVAAALSMPALPAATAVKFSAAKRLGSEPVSAATPALSETVALIGGSAPLPPRASTNGPTGSLDRYQRIAELGRGAMGVVYRARDVVLDRDVALKIMTDEMRGHPEALAFFIQEAKALAQLNHGNVVTVYDQGRDGDTVYMIMEFVEGSSLESLIECETLPLHQALDIVQQLCAGLAYAHERKVLHRDIKPANILVTSAGAVKLGDFGLARVVHELRIRKTEIRGTPLYMAPEQITGIDIDVRTDLYAVGCTLFELLTGRPPFIDGDVLYHHMHTAPPRPSALVEALPPELDGLVVRCIQKDKDKRFSSATELRERLKMVVQRYG